MVVGAVAGRAAEATAVTRLGVRGMMGGGNSPDVFWRFLPPRIGIHRQEIDDVGPVLLDAQVSSMVFLIRDLLYVSLLLEHNRGAGRSEPSERGGQLLSPRAPGAGPSLSSAGSPLEGRAIGLLLRVDLPEHPRKPPPVIPMHRQEVDDVGPVLPVLVAVAHQ
jgi:hypothetical protein